MRALLKSSVVVLVVGISLLCAATSYGDMVIASHSGANDPLEEGMTMIEGSNGFAVPDDGGVAAWNMNGADNTAGHVLTTGELALAAEGWSMSGNVRITTASSSGGFMISRVNDKRLQVRIHSDASNNAYVECWNKLGTFYNVGSGGYHNYELVVRSGGAVGDLYVDHNIALSDIPCDVDEGLNYVAFQGATANWNSFQATVVPEPSSLVLSVAGLLGLLAYAWRKRK